VSWRQTIISAGGCARGRRVTNPSGGPIEDVGMNSGRAPHRNPSISPYQTQRTRGSESLKRKKEALTQGVRYQTVEKGYKEIQFRIRLEVNTHRAEKKERPYLYKPQEEGDKRTGYPIAVRHKPAIGIKKHPVADPLEGLFFRGQSNTLYLACGAMFSSTSRCLRKGACVNHLHGST